MSSVFRDQYCYFQLQKTYIQSVTLITQNLVRNCVINITFNICTQDELRLQGPILCLWLQICCIMLVWLMENATIKDNENTVRYWLLMQILIYSLYGWSLLPLDQHCPWRQQESPGCPILPKEFRIFAGIHIYGIWYIYRYAPFWKVWSKKIGSFTL